MHPDPAERPARSGAADLRVLVLAPTGRDGPLACQFLRPAGITAESCPDMPALCREIERGAGAVLLAEEALDQASFALLTGTLGRQPPWSDLPIVLFTATGERPHERQVALRLSEALSNVIYLQRPMRVQALLNTVRVALQARRRQYEVREHLIERERTAAELRQQAAKLAETDRHKDQFLAMLGHELRNPLSAINNGLVLLSGGGDAGGMVLRPERRERVLALLRRQTEHLGRLVDDLLDVSRVTTGKVTLRCQRLDLGGVVRHCVQAMAPLFQGQGQHLAVTVDEGALVVDGDPVRLEQVLTNLLHNAAKYTQPGGHVELSLRLADGWAVLRVWDDGIGIPAEVLPHVFDLFAQADPSLDRAQGGMGIGLTLVRSLVEMHGGTVAAASAGPGQGSELTVRLPLAPEARDVAPAPEAPPGAVPEAAPRRILLIEDNADVRETLQMLLCEMGHQVSVAGDGLRGVARARAERPEVALVDIGLPGMNGYEVARQVRAALGPAVMLVAMTGYGQPEDRRLTQEAGFDAHLTKPADLATLTAVLRRPAGPGPARRAAPSAGR